MDVDAFESGMLYIERNRRRFDFVLEDKKRIHSV